MKSLSRLMVSCIGLLTAFMLVWAPGHSHASVSLAKTSPPPPEIQIQSAYSGYTYLQASYRSIKDNLNQTVTITVTTEAKQTVSELGGTVYLQRYTGTQWVDVGSGNTLKSVDTNYASKSITLTTTSGYYYRARVVHYAKHNGTTEQATEYTDTILAK